MKHIHKIMLFLSVATLLNACKEEDEDKMTSMTIEGIKAEAFSGAIRLSWNPIEIKDFLYSEVSYFDFGTQKTVTNLCSRYTENLYIDGLLNKYGNYKFTFTVFDKNKRPGQPVYIERACEKAESYYVISEENVIPLTTGQLSTNAQEPSEGPISNLVDGDPATFFQSFWDEWGYPALKPSGYHYISIDLQKEVTALRFQTWNRISGGSKPKSVNIYGSLDGNNWTLLDQLNNLPTDGGAIYSSELYLLDEPVSHIKYEVVKGSDEYQSYFSLAEIEFYEIVRELIDPEAE